MSELPEAIIKSWTEMDGLAVKNPMFEILPISMAVREEGLIVFVRCDGTVRLAFCARKKDIVGEWSIVNADTGYRSTYPMASFWSIHMWTWIAKRRPIWFDVNSSDRPGTS